MTQEYLLEAEGISKFFPGVIALKDVDLYIKKGSVHAVVGENGAGKSTLMKIIAGLHRADSGVIKFAGEVVHFRNPREALDAGISMIHQELDLVPELTVAQSIFLGREPAIPYLARVKEKELNQRAKELLENLKIRLEPSAKIKHLSVGDLQLVEIARAVSFDSKLIIMDEPTSALTKEEVENLFRITNTLKARGISVVYITHRLDEVFEIADEVTVLRDGQVVGRGPIKDFNKDKIVTMMVGRELKQLFPKEEAEITDVILEVRNLSGLGFRDVSFVLRKGEILGVAGLIGAGRTETMEAIFGLRPITGGEIFVKGQKVEIKSPKDAIKHRMAYLPEDRRRTGLFLMHTVEKNITIATLEKYFNKKLTINKRVCRDLSLRQVKTLRIKTPSIEEIIERLSGGNQQKVLLGRWLLSDADIFILDEPTRGIDVGAKAEIHTLVGGLVKEGKGVILVSSELPEVLGMSDRIIVMCEGKVTGELSRKEATQDVIMKHAIGIEIGSESGSLEVQ